MSDKPTVEQFRERMLCKRRREIAYPPMADYVDGVVKLASQDPAIQAIGRAQVEA